MNVRKAILELCFTCQSCNFPNWILLDAIPPRNPRREDVKTIKCWKCMQVFPTEDTAIDGDVAVYKGTPTATVQKYD